MDSQPSGSELAAMYLPSLKGLADETRLRLVSILQSGAFNGNELGGILAMGQSRVSRHLKILHDAGLVEARREGVWVYYRLSDPWSAHRSPGSQPRLRYLRLLRHELSAVVDGDREAVERCLQRRRETANDFFRRVAPEWDDQRDEVQGRPGHLESVAEVLGDSETVVDLGTGTGVLLPTLSQQAKSVIGIDASAEMRHVARRIADRRKLNNVELRLGTVEHLPVPDAAADAIVANMVLHHVAHPPDALREIRRVLRPRGRFVLADLAEHSDEAYREKLGDLWLGFARDEIERWLDEAGFEVDQFQELENGESPAILLVAATSRAGERERKVGATADD